MYSGNLTKGDLVVLKKKSSEVSLTVGYLDSKGQFDVQDGTLAVFFGYDKDDFFRDRTAIVWIPGEEKMGWVWDFEAHPITESP